MLEISILKVENPSCLWGRIIKDLTEVDTPAKYGDLQVKMNLLYHNINIDVQKTLTLTSVEEGQVCVVYCPSMKNWCRAVVESINLNAEQKLAMCYLVDHGTYISVKCDEIRSPVQKFLQLPFWVKKFHLSGLHPTTMQLSFDGMKAELVPCTRWDMSATRYLHNLLQASTQTEAVLHETQDGSTAIELYLTIKDVKIYVNDELVAKKFACYSSSMVNGSTGKEDKSPVFLAHDIYCDTKTFLSNNCCPVRPSTPPRHGDWYDHESSGPLELPGSILPEKSPEGNPTSSSKPMDPREVLGSTSPTDATANISDIESDGTENTDTDASLCAALQTRLSIARLFRFLTGSRRPRPVINTNLNEELNDELDESLTQDHGAENEGKTDTHIPVASCNEVNGVHTSLLPLLSNPVESMVAEDANSDFSNLHARAESPTPSLVSMKSDLSKDDPMRCLSNEPGPPDANNLHPRAESPTPSLVSMKSDLSKDDPMHCLSNEPGPPDANVPTNLPESLSEEVYTKPTYEEIYACKRLAEWLNPAPLNSPESEEETHSTDDDDVQVVPVEPTSSNNVLLHSVMAVEPCTSLARAPITDVVQRILTRKKYSGPSVSESYCWPAVTRGSDTLLISSTADDPMNYIPPFLLHVQSGTLYTSTFTHKAGPLAVILCPGWEKAQTVCDIFEDLHATQSLHPTVMLVGVGKDEGTATKIPRHCQVVITTPFSLVRLLACHLRLFLRLCHLVLDEADVLFSQAPDEMHTIMQHFQKVTSGEERINTPKQIVAVGKHWSSHMESLLNTYMTFPSVIITVMEEAALYGNVHQMNVLCLESTKITALVGALDLHPEVGQKTLIICSSAQEVEHVFKAVSKTSAFCLKTHEGLTQQFDFVIQQWRKEIGPGTQVILVTTTDCLKALWVRDATCVIHYGFPTSPKRFGSSLFCMSDNFRNLSNKDLVENKTPAKSILIITEMDARHMVGVLRYLKRSDALLPPELLSFAEGVVLAKEQQKTDRPLCSYLKSFGVCRDSDVCPDRHWFSSTTDQSLLPDSGTITVLPLCIKTASVFYGRIVKNQDDSYESLASKMVSYYATEKLVVKDVVDGGLYGVEEKEVYHRVKVTSVPDKKDLLFFSVKVCFLDEGREQEVKSYQLLHLPAQFHTLPPQAVEIVVCRVKPLDKEVDWNPKATRAIGQKIRGLQHQARVVLSLGNTIFVDPMVRMTRMPGLRTLINEYNVHAEILSTGMAVSNPDHLSLQKEHKVTGEHPHGTGMEASIMAVEPGVRTANAALAVVISRADKRNAAGGPNVLVDPVCPLQTCPQAAASSYSLQVQQPVALSQPSEIQPVGATHPYDVPVQPCGPLHPTVPVQPRGPLQPTVPVQPCAPLHPAGPVQPCAPLHPAGPVQPCAPLHPAVPVQPCAPLHPAVPVQPCAPLQLAVPVQPCAPLQPAVPVQPCAPLQPVFADQTKHSDKQPLVAGQWNDILAHLKKTALMLSNGNKGSTPQKLIPSENGLPISKNQGNNVPQPIGGGKPTESLHPQIKWHQSKDSLIVNVKLSNPVSQKCEFHANRVVYSAIMNDRPYRADLELDDGIVADQCSWTMKCNEPVLTLVKQQKGYWDKLVKHKNNCVRYDLHYYEDIDEEHTPKGGRFVASIGDDNDVCCHVVQSSSDSDSDLD